MRYPEALKPGGKIGFVAPSFGCNIEPYKTAFLNALSKFKEMGYETVTGPNCFEGRGIGISNTPYECGKEINEYFQQDKADILISCGGGELMCEILNYIDFDKLKREQPKWFMGYSDNTNLTFLLTTLCDTAAIYGPCAAAFGMEPWHLAINDAFKLLTGKIREVSGYKKYETESLKDELHPLVPYNVTEEKKLHIYGASPEAYMEGRLIGGCMDCLVNLLGTKFDRVSDFLEKYRADGFIWFLESCDLNVMAIRRAMWQMDNAGWFKYVKGFVIGRPAVHGQELMGMNQYDAVTGITDKYKVPVIMDADIGHIPPQMPVVCGAFGKIKTENGEIYMDYEFK